MTDPTIINARTREKITLRKGDIHYFVPKPGTDLIESYVLTTGRYGDEIWREAGPLIDSSKAILDIGGSMGTAATELAKITSGNVHTFEPQRKMYYKLITNLVLSGCENFYAYNFALGDSSQHDMETKIYDRTPGNSSMSTLAGSDTPEAKGDMSKFAHETVTVKSIDRFFNITSDRDVSKISTVGFIKIDTEGFELQVLRGAVGLIKRDMPVIAFECPGFSKTLPDILELMDSLGYDCSLLVTCTYDWLAIPKTMDKTKYLENRTTYLRTIPVAQRFAWIRKAAERKDWSVSVTLLESIDPVDESKDVSLAQRVTWYDEAMQALWYTNAHERFNDTAYKFLKLMQTGLYDNLIDDRMLNNFGLVKVMEYKETKELHVDDYKTALASLVGNDLHAVKHVIYAKNWDPRGKDRYWGLNHSNLQVKLWQSTS